MIVLVLMVLVGNLTLNCLSISLSRVHKEPFITFMKPPKTHTEREKTNH